MEGIQNWVENITIYMIFTTLLYKVNGNKAFQPYLKLISGLLMIVLLIDPLLQLKHIDFSKVFQQEMSKFQIESVRITQDIYQTKSKEIILSAYESEFRQRLEEELLGYGLYLQELEVAFNQSDAYGEIEAISMEVAYQQEYDGVEMGKAMEGSLTKIRELKIKQWLKDNYQVGEEKIEIKLKK